jgi:hypothetical protein
MDHEAAPFSPISVSAGLALLPYQGAEVSESEKNQISLKEDFALATPEESSPFAGTEKNGELVLSHPKKNPVSRDIWLDPGHFVTSGTRPLRRELVPRNEIVFNTGLKVNTS